MMLPVLHALPLRHFTFAVHAGARQFRELHVRSLFLFQGFVFPSVGCPSHRACRQVFVSSCCPPGGWPWFGQHRRRGDRPPCVCRSAGSCVHRGCGPVRSSAVAWVVDFWLVCQQARLCGSSMVTTIPAADRVPDRLRRRRSERNTASIAALRSIWKQMPTMAHRLGPGKFLYVPTVEGRALSPQAEGTPLHAGRSGSTERVCNRRMALLISHSLRP